MDKFLPGDPVNFIKTDPVQHNCRRGVYEKKGKLFASLSSKFFSSDKTHIVPTVDDRVICQVLRISSKHATVQILSTEQHCFYPLHYKGTIRQQDVRDYDRDKVVLYKSFRPGDIVIAEVLGTGDSSQGLLLSTAKDNLGVIIARSIQSNGLMVPVSCELMQCPSSKSTEPRKCAKV